MSINNDALVYSTEHGDLRKLPPSAPQGIALPPTQQTAFIQRTSKGRESYRHEGRAQSRPEGRLVIECVYVENHGRSLSAPAPPISQSHAASLSIVRPCVKGIIRKRFPAEPNWGHSRQMRDVLAGITPIAAGLALAVIIHRAERASRPDARGA